MDDIEIREICGDYALDLKYPDETIVIFFNSYRNALNVKRIIEVDGSVPNVATVADFAEVIRCKDCKHRDKSGLCQAEGQKLTIAKDNHFCSKGERRSDK